MGTIDATRPVVGEIHPLLLFSAATRGVIGVLEESRRVVRVETTCKVETPPPVDLVPWVVTLPTGSLTVVESPDQLVQSASRYMRALAFLGIDERDEQIVDDLFARHTMRSSRRALARRRASS